MNAPIRLLIADDHSIVREGLRLILEMADDISVVGEACDGQQAIELAEELEPDVILMDLRMPGVDGLAAIQHLGEHQPTIAIIILTTYDEDELMLQGLQAGARGYLIKDVKRGRLMESIRAAARGDTLLAPDILSRVLSFQHNPSREAIETNLTDRELEVLLLVAEGERNKEIAYHLSISERTVKGHLTNIYNKLGVDSRAAAIARAAQLKLL